MVRRRCRYVLAIDAGEDPDSYFEDLGNAVRKIRIDFGVDIVFKPQVAIGSRHNPVSPFLDFACASIHYPEKYSGPGCLIYLKPSFPSYVAMDVMAYGNRHDTFPHESTVDQFFTESQFESYRQLGVIEASRLASEVTTIADFFKAALDKITRAQGDVDCSTAPLSVGCPSPASVRPFLNGSIRYAINFSPASAWRTVSCRRP
jgi:hypothetical protein